MKKLADIALERGKIIFSEEGKEIDYKDAKLIQPILKEMILTNKEDGVLLYMSKKEIADYLDLINNVDDGR